MDTLSNLWLGLGVAMMPANLLYCLVGVLLGTLVGVLPGIGPVATVAMLLPVTFTLPPASALDHAGRYLLRCGAICGGSTTAILINTPGNPSVVTPLDGHHMARQGRPVRRSASAAIGSFIAGCVATLVVAYLAPPLAEVALEFGACRIFLPDGVRPDRRRRSGTRIAPEGDCHGSARPVARYCRHRRQLRCATLPFRYTRTGRRYRLRRVDHGDIRNRGGRGQSGEEGKPEHFLRKRSGLCFLPLDDLRRCFWTILRSTGLGAVLGILPGGGALLASFAAYALERRLRPSPRNFGHGDIRGVAAPESANAGAQTSFCSDDHARYSVQSHHGDDDRRADDPGHRARPAGHAGAAGIVLGLIASRCSMRQSDAGDPEPAIDPIWIWLIRMPTVSVSVDPAVLLYRVVFDQQHSVRPFIYRAVRRCVRLHPAQAECEPALAHPELHPRADDGGKPAPALLIRSRQRQRSCDAAAQPGLLLASIALIVVIAAPAVRQRDRGDAGVALVTRLNHA